MIKVCFECRARLDLTALREGFVFYSGRISFQMGFEAEYTIAFAPRGYFPFYQLVVMVSGKEIQLELLESLLFAQTLVVFVHDIHTRAGAPAMFERLVDLPAWAVKIDILENLHSRISNQQPS